MQTVITKYLAPTNTRGSRIKVISAWGSKIYPYDYAANEPHKEAFDLFLAEQNEIMKAQYGTECPADGWWKLVAYADSLDSRGLTFIIK